MCGTPLLHPSCGVAIGPLAGSLSVLFAVVLVEIGNFWHKRVVGVGVREQRADWEKHLGDGEGGWPLVLKDVQANRAVGIDVWVIDFRLELHLRGLEGVVRRESNVQEEDATRVGRVFRAHDSCLPSETVIIISRSSRAIGGRVSAKVNKFFLDSFQCHICLFDL